ncbi:hypothetical protein MPH_11578 [Macrophomina phaseolina MS6]|uniref:Uncharacterized protein n=1 Tax=Macrophomina phaseolina (strain MS6) TaxID=1126212 RepID=K2RA14_MACPH|nr:hypothetical protein MPH_11578 [Macrophomina phaseolina MS6]
MVELACSVTRELWPRVPFAGLRSLTQALPPWSSATSRLASLGAVPAQLPRIRTAPPKYYGLRPPLLRFLECRQFGTTATALARRPSAAPRKPESASKLGRKDGKARGKDEEDTPLPGGDLPRDKITNIFGPGTSAKEGNAVLRALQHRRVTGSLAEKGINFEHGGPAAVPKERLLNALEYLRSEYPVDEEAAAVEWAEREAERLEAELIERAQNLRLYKKSDQGQTLGSVYGHSELEALRKRNEELYERQREEEERQAAIRESEGLGKTGTLGPVKAKAELRKKLCSNC